MSSTLRMLWWSVGEGGSTALTPAGERVKAEGVSVLESEWRRGVCSGSSCLSHLPATAGQQLRPFCCDTNVQAASNGDDCQPLPVHARG